MLANSGRCVFTGTVLNEDIGTPDNSSLTDPSERFLNGGFQFDAHSVRA